MKIASKIQNRVSTYLLLFVLIAIFFASLILVLNSFDNNSLVYAEWVGDGSGTQDDPYLIGTKAQLEKFRDIVDGRSGEIQHNNICGKLTANIDLGCNVDNQWVPIGSYNGFYGTFDGHGFTISGLYIKKENVLDGMYGLFARTENGAVVKRLTVEGTIDVIADRDTYAVEVRAGGIVAKNAGRILYCTNKVNISCVATGDFYSARIYVGGITGENYGSLYTRTQIKYCVNEGNINGYTYTGGIVGVNRSLIYLCSNKGTVGTTNGDVGGIAGQLYDSYIENCYNIGNINYTPGTAAIRAGGLAGELGDENSQCYFGRIVNSFNYGSLNKLGEGSETRVGGITGFADENAYINNAVMKTDGSIEPVGVKHAANLNVLSTHKFELSDFKTEANFTDIGWDFVDKWKMENDADYPTIIIGYDIYIDCALVTDERMSGDGWEYDADDNKITLNNYSYEGTGYTIDGTFFHLNSAILYNYYETLEINLIGTNEIINTLDSENAVYAIGACYLLYDDVGNFASQGGSLKFTGNGTLIAKTGKYSLTSAIFAQDEIIINGGNITAVGNNVGIFGYTSVTINDGIVNAAGGFGISATNYNPIIIGENAKSVTATGSQRAIGGTLKNSIAGIGWTDELGTEGENGIAINTSGAECSGYKKVDFGVKYLVEFDKKGGSGGSNSARAIYGATTSSIAIPSKAGNAFKGYFDAEINGKKYYDANGASIEAWDRLEGATLYAHWEKKPEVVAVDDKIEAIGEVAFTPECKQKIEEARAAYEALSPEDRPGLDYYNELIKAEEDYAALEEAHNNPPAPNQEQDTTASQETSPTPSQQDENKATQNESKPEKKNNLGLIIGIIVGVVLIAGLLLWFFIFKKKKDDDNDDEPQGRNDTKKEVVIDAPNENIGENAEAATKAENESAKEDK